MAYSEEQLKLLKESQSLMRLLGIDLEKQADIQDEILRGTIQTVNQLQQQVDVIRRHAVEERKVTKEKQIPYYVIFK